MQSNWYVAYTYPNAEKRVQQRVEESGKEAFLPTQEVVGQWSDRKKKLNMPLFPNYVFVKSEPFFLYKLLEINQLVNFVQFEGKPAVVDPDTIKNIRQMLAGELDLEINHEDIPHYSVGQEVTISGGCFEGVDGILMEHRGNRRLLVSIKVLNTTISVNLPANCIVAHEKIHHN